LCADGTRFDSGVVGDGGAGWRWEPPGDDARFSIAPGDYALPVLEDVSSDAASTATHADVVRVGLLTADVSLAGFYAWHCQYNGC
jgi:hypothetical protein